MTKLIADIGGTNARFALVGNDNKLAHIKVFACADFETPGEAAKKYLTDIGTSADTGAFAVATPVDGSDKITMTNHVWDFSIKETAQIAGLQNLKVINDFAALAMAVPYLTPADYYQLGSGTAVAKMPIGIIGPGTGLGVSAVVFDANGKPVAISTEGGHVTMPATSSREHALFDYLITSGKYHHISAERVCSGKGLVNLHTSIASLDGLTLPERTAEEIAQAGLDGTCKTCVEIIDLFCHFLGVTAGNLALSYGAAGGIFIAGGIVPKLGDYFKKSRFRDSFESKGRFRGYQEKIPTFVITHPYPGLVGLQNI